MKNPITLLLFLFSCFQINAQQYDNTWLVGYGTTVNDPIWGDTRIEFNDIQSPEIFAEEFDMRFSNTSTVMSSEEGNLIFYSNGIYVADANHDPVEDSYGLNPGVDFTFFETLGYNVDQGILTLPYPGHESEYLIVHTDMIRYGEEHNFYTSAVRYTHILQEDEGLPIVIEKNIPINEGLFETGQLTACKHANGRDWWVIHPDLLENKYYIFLLTPSGIELSSTQVIGDFIQEGLGQATFSPDGTKYIRYQVYEVDGDLKFLYLDFNRCTGELSNPQAEDVTQYAFCAGGAISPNSRYFYASSFDYIYQYDLWVDDIPASRVTVAEYDGYVSPTLPTVFYLMQLAPDGKIYCSTYSTNDVMHVIHHPNRGGTACHVEQHGVQLPTMNRASIPNNPNYRLGPLDGSSCDTLGLDNLPLCDFRYTLDTLDDKRIEFTDVSFYEPTDWIWTFGDGASSTEQNPAHEYSASGTYEVCVTISNEYGSDSKCRTLQIISTDTDEFELSIAVSSMPNPAVDFIYLQNKQNLPSNSEWILRNINGRIVQKESLSAGAHQHRIDLAELPAGMYVQSIEAKNSILWRERVVIAE